MYHNVWRGILNCSRAVNTMCGLLGFTCLATTSKKRTELYDFLGIISEEAARAKADLIAAGDWNAVWQGSDRVSGKLSALDIQHRLALEQMGLCPVQAENRSKTYGCMLPEGASRIDDVFISSGHKLNSDRVQAEEVLPIGERSDHLPLKITLTLPKASISCTPPGGPDAQAPASMSTLGFVRPLAPGQKQMLRSHLEGFKMNEVSTAADNILQMYEEAKAVHSSSICRNVNDQPVSMATRAQFAHELEKKMITKDTIDAMAATLTYLISGMNLAALEVLPAMPDPTKRKLYRPRAMNRKYQKLRRERKWLVKKMLNRDKVTRDGGCSQNKFEAAELSQGSNMFSSDLSDGQGRG